jgi:hypothetical protein
MQMVWNALRDALQPIKLRDLASVLPGFVARIAKSSWRPSGQRQHRIVSVTQLAMAWGASAVRAWTDGIRGRLCVDAVRSAAIPVEE